MIKVYINKNYAFKISLIENRYGRYITEIVYTSTIIHEYQSTLYSLAATLRYCQCENADTVYSYIKHKKNDSRKGCICVTKSSAMFQLSSCMVKL